MKTGKFSVGTNVWFEGEVQKYTIQAMNDRFAICTKPHNPRKTVIYTIIDIVEQIRGTENLIFSMGAETKGQCEEMLGRLENYESEISYRNRISLMLR